MKLNAMLFSVVVQYIILFVGAFNETDGIVNATTGKMEHVGEKRSSIIKKREPIKLNSKQGLIMNQILNIYGIDNVGNALCVNHSLEFKNALRAFEPWALKMVDASSKLQSGLISGNLVEFGSFKQCIYIEAPTSSGIIKGKQCTLKITPPLNVLKKMLSYRGISAKRFEKNIAIFEDAGVYWSVCIPDSCESEDVLKHFSKHLKSIGEGLNLSIALDDLFCSSLQDEPVLRTKQYIVIYLILGVIGLSFFCSLIDMCSNKRSKIKELVLIDIFSSYRNAKHVLAHDIEDVLGLRCLDGIRFLSIAYVVFGHSFLMLLFAPSVNSLELMEWLLKYSSTVIIGGTVSVDSFFMLGGVLVAYHTLDSLSKSNGKFNWIFFIIYRFVRLTPPYAMAILVDATLIQFFGSGPLWRKVAAGMQAPCQYFWWSALINMQNYINPKFICITQSWFLTADFVYYALSPLLTYPLWKYEIIGWLNLVIFYIISVMVNFYLAWLNQYGAGMLVTNRLLQTDYFAYHYIAPHVRASTYILGIGLGTILHRTKDIKMKLHPVTVAVGWIWSSVLMLATILGNHPFQLEAHEYDRVETSFYLAMSRSSWTVGLMWVVWVCNRGYGGPVNMFLKNPIFQVLAKLSYSIFIWHLPFQFLLVGALKQPVYFSDFNMIYRFFGELCIVIAFSLLYVILFECPCIRLGRHLKFRNRRVADKI